MGRGREAEQGPAGTLFVVSTPIGNLGDITARAADTLRTADVVLAEDTRTSRVLLDHLGIRPRMIAVHEHNEAEMVPEVVQRLARGERVALICDAGTPAVSDPGGRLVRAVREAGFRVSPVPGPSALTAALAGAGLDTSRFTFYGFLPRTGRARQEAVDAISALDHTGVLYEAPGRAARTLSDLAGAGAGARRCVVARELTKVFEEFREGTVADLARYYAEHAPRGEVVVLVAGREPEAVDEEGLRERAQALRRQGLSARDIATRLAAETGAPRNVIYRLALKE